MFSTLYFNYCYKNPTVPRELFWRQQILINSQQEHSSGTALPTKNVFTQTQQLTGPQPSPRSTKALLSTAWHHMRRFNPAPTHGPKTPKSGSARTHGQHVEHRHGKGGPESSAHRGISPRAIAITSQRMVSIIRPKRAKNVKQIRRSTKANSTARCLNALSAG